LSAICIQALKSFSRAIHINPASTELREDDLMWAAELVHRKASVDTTDVSTASSINNNTELDSDGDSVEDDNQLTAQHIDSSSFPSEPSDVELEKLPSNNYVIMRD